MPFTFSHPSAVLPLKGVRFLDFTALVIGSLTPDLGYYLQLFPLATYAHTAWGTVLVSLPSGWLLLGAFYAFRRPLCYLLPDPHRSALGALMAGKETSPPCVSARFLRVLILSCSLVVGAGTHLFWDSFTHQSGWMVERIEFLQKPLLNTLPAYYLLQQLSTLVGGAILGVAYFRWIWKPHGQRQHPFSFPKEKGRLIFLAVLAVLAAVIALPFSWKAAAVYSGFLAVRVFVFRTAITFIAAFIPLLLFGAAIAYRRATPRG